ncbi:HipA domain-containing protein [Ideonella sp. DXS22W]|uniref:HipA domain-containing protein n=1 Tax=Pseudaquabacterium inlustre TaxID=2984192 RepID=A0ABU9CPT5_9BURK
MAVLGVSQPTLSRAIQRLGPAVTTFKPQGERTPRYALLRPLPDGLPPRQRIYRVLRSGSIEPFADVEFLVGGATLERIGKLARLYEGLPPYMVFAAPSGFLGRQVAGQASRGQPSLPVSLKDWGDYHRVVYLFLHGTNTPGNLLYGELPVQQSLNLRQIVPTTVAEKLGHYDAMAAMLREASHGSSAGGEQPKFLARVEDAGHVIVKFARRGSRMAELLPLEHLALKALADVGVPAATTQLLASSEHVFLEVQRFDRVGPHGRLGMLSAGAVDDEFFGLRDTWSQFARRCAQAGYISAAHARLIDVMAAFSELIGNTDRHFENLSLLIGEDGEYAGVAPAYDILPMRYASIGGGVDPALRPITPQLGAVGAQPAVWLPAARAAEQFWSAVQTAELAAPISQPWRQLAETNRQVARDFVQPLLPDVPVGR